jgi:hypothetical protein
MSGEIIIIDEARGTFQTGRVLYLCDPNDKKLLEFECVKKFLKIKTSTQNATLSFIWCMQQQNILPNELIEKIAKEVWESRQQEPAMWLHV